jgi:rhodanese-related sulfurtransferase
VRFVYRTLSIVALAIAAGLTHSWFVPTATSFGGATDRGEGQRRDRTPQPPPEGAGGDPAPTGAGADPTGGQQAPDPGGESGGQADPGAGAQPDETPPPPPPPPPQDIDLGSLGDFITVEEAHAIWQEGHIEANAFVAFLDARYPEEYAKGHITTARRLMAGDITDGTGAETLNWLLELEPDFVVIYCEGGECDASKNLARQLERNTSLTREQLHVLEPGYPAWAETYPALITQGDEPGEPG